MEYNIKHTPEKKRFETTIEDVTAFVEYLIEDGCLIIEHTIVPHKIEGRGIAASLVKSAYDFALENDLKPEAECSYAVAWLKRHPEYKKIDKL